MLSAIVYKQKSSNQVKPLKKSPPNSSSEQITVNVLETRLYRSVHVLLILSELFVCLPYGAHRRLPTTTSSCSDKILMLLHITWSIGIYVSLVFTIYGEYTQSDKDLPTVQKPLFFCEYLVYLVHLFQILLSTYWARQKCRRFLHTIAEFDYKLISFGRPPEYQQLNRFIRAHLYLILLYVVATAVVDYFYTAGIMTHFIRSLAVYLLPNLVLCFSLVQYYTLLYAIAQRIIWLNEILHAELSLKTSARVLREKLQDIRLSYSTLQIFTKEVNNSFALSLVLVYIGSFTNLSVNLFLLYKYLDDASNSTFSWIMYSLVWTSMHIGKMFCILYFNYGVQSQVV
ncbi:PREDICTED: putative gustatory receptor 59f [Rhagoletis zephyria]|uniref:putative gustatory receptor 59f n=1 Tax=Rhagoletis zephyria TaxID=28612 RepID=UPI000811737B|nr:PREDICTED: putative gustatory receptor 59f [Rhagoletis zephyria]